MLLSVSFGYFNFFLGGGGASVNILNKNNLNHNCKVDNVVQLKLFQISHLGETQGVQP